jgi:uncharacterized protein (DUF885 family)
MRATLACALAALGLMMMTSARAAPADDLHALVKDYERYALDQDPVLAGQQGDKAALRRWPDDRPRAIAAHKAALVGFQKRLTALAAASLAGEDAINRAFLQDLVDRKLEGLSFDEERLPFVADDGFYNLPDYVARGTVVKSRDDELAWIARLEALPAWYQAEIANARRGVATGFTQPALVVEATLKTARSQAAGAAETSSLLLPLEKAPPGVSEADQARLRAQSLAIVRERIKPAQRGLVTFLEREYGPKARPALGLSSLPDGKRYYAYLARSYTTTQMTPEAIHALGLLEVARIRAEMEKAVAETGFKGSFPEFLAFLRHDPRFYPTSREALMAQAKATAARIDGKLPSLFGHLPKLPYEVRPAPAEVEESYTSARYWTGSPETGSPGIYIVNTSHLDQRPLYELPVLTLHEAIPGHHTQIALAQENKAIPVFRRSEDLTVFVEGWALYAEGLGEEMGIYRDPYERFGRLSFDMWRACRLVVDTGLHWMGWSREQARACLADNTALSDKNIDVEIDRYIGDPGQALAYKLGQLKIAELRRRAEAALGAKFDVRAFHDLILDEGPLPLDMLEARVDGWIAAQR